MIYRTLGELRSELARRLGFGATGSAGINAGLLDSFLQNAQDQIYSQFDWRHLVTYDDKLTGVGQTLYDWEADCDPIRITQIAINDGTRWVPMKEGIDWPMRSDDTQSTPCRYERFAQMEVWPAPDAIYTMRRYYVQAPARFTQDNDRASIDDALIFLHALTNAKLHYKQQDGQSYANQLSAMITKLKGQNRGQAVHHREPDSVYLARPRDV
jgi:hypothetical protein